MNGTDWSECGMVPGERLTNEVIYIWPKQGDSTNIIDNRRRRFLVSVPVMNSLMHLTSP